jgi:type VI secretion system protein VasJ
VLSWLTERVRTELASALARADVEQVRAIWSAFAGFRDVVRTRFPDRGPALGPVEQAFALLPADKRPAQESASPTPPPLLEAGAAEDEILRPIAGSDPCGDDPRLCDEFEQLRVEVAKVGSVAGEDAAWPKVAALSRKILGQRGKDLRCLAYLAIARLRTEGANGFAEALATMAACAERFADGLHPRRPKTRGGALVWLGERLQAETARQPMVISAELLARTRGDLARAKAALEGLCDDTNGLSLADEALSRVKPRATAAAIRPPAAPVPARTRPPTSTQTASTGAPTDDPGIAATAQALLEAARSRAAAGSEDATSLRLRRLALWMTPPEALPAKKHECDCGNAQQRAELAALAAGENWPELLQRCETELESMPFWLDLTWFSIKAAHHVLGKDAVRALKGELGALVLRHPGLLSGFDRKGQWLASKEVRDWFARELTPRPPPEAADGADGAKPEAAASPTKTAVRGDGELPELPEELQKLLETKRFDDAVAGATQWIAAAQGRTRFARNVVFARRCQEAGLAKLAFSLFRALEGQMRRATMAEWDPLLATLCLRGFLSSKVAMGVPLGAQDERLIDELALLDPRAMTGLLR